MEKKIGTGKRKTSVARIFLSTDNIDFVVNGKPVQEYFDRASLLVQVKTPLVLTEQEGKIGVKAFVEGGGIAGQAGAVQYGIAKALLNMNPLFRSILKPQGLLTRDDRKVERKKPGLKKARKSPQFSKR